MKNKILIRYKILDFIGKKVWEVIDCNTKAGKDRYRELFGKEIFKNSKKSNTTVLKPNQMLLEWYLHNNLILNEKRLKKRFYKRHYIPTNIQDIDEYILPIIDELSFESNSGYDGSLYQLFLAAELQYFDELQESKNIVIRVNYCDFKDIIKLEIARIRLGFNEIDQFLKKLNINVRINCILTKEVYKKRNEFEKFCLNNLKVDELVFLPVSIKGHAKENQSLFLNYNESRKFIKSLESSESLNCLPFYKRLDRKSTRLNSSHTDISRMPSSA